MSAADRLALADRIAREHIAKSTTSGLGCTCGGWRATYTHADPMLTGLDQHRAHIATVTEAAVREEYIELLEDLADPDECSFDHHGGCQAHGYLGLKPGEMCPQEMVRHLIARYEAGQ